MCKSCREWSTLKFALRNCDSISKKKALTHFRFTVFCEFDARSAAAPGLLFTVFAAQHFAVQCSQCMNFNTPTCRDI